MMVGQNRLILHSIIYIAAKLLPGVLAVTTTAVLTRLLNPEQYGLYGLALVVMTFGASIGFDWLHVSFLRFSQSRAETNIVKTTIIHLFLAVVGLTAALFLLAWCLGLITGPEAPVYVVGFFLMWAYSWFELVSGFEIGSFRPMTFFIMNCSRAAAIAVASIAAAWLTRSPVWTGIGTGSGMLIGSLFGHTSGIRLGRSAFDPTLARALMVFGLPLATVYLVSSGVNAGSRALVDWLGSAYALGLYTAAFLLVQNSLSVIAGAIASAGFALAVRAVESGNAEDARKQLLANGTLLLAVLAPASLGMALTARGIATLLVAPDYVEVVAKLTPWMAASAFFAGIRSHFLDHAFQLGRRPTMLIWVGGVAAILSIVLTAILLPRLGPLGAAIAVTVAMAVSCIHSRLAGRWGYPLPMPVLPSAGIAVACLAMSIVVLSLSGPTPLHFAAQVVLGALTYAIVALLCNVLESRVHLTIWLGLRSKPARSDADMP
jgi:O-antigen/teichoic acid export membrane protein